MSCNFNKETLEAFALSLLEGDEKSTVAAHVAECAECRSFVMKRRETVQMLAHAFTDEPPDWLIQKTMAELGHRNAIPWFKRYLLPVSVSAALVAVVAAFIMFPDLQTGRAHFMQSSHVQTLTYSEQSSDHQSRSNPQSVQQGTAVYDAYSDEFNDDTADFGKNQQADTDIHAVLGLIFKNPVADRSIYTSLGVHKEIAALLL